MNIKYLQKILSSIDEIKIIGKNAEIEGVICNVAGIVRYGLQLRLAIFEYDELYRQEIEEIEIAEFCDDGQVTETNRIMMKGKEKVSQPFRTIKSVFIGDTEFEVSGSENQRLSVKDGESVLFISELLRNGWNPEGIDYQDIDMLFITMVELVGEFSKIPDFEKDSLMHFTMRKDSASYLVEQPVKLVVNSDYPEKLLFKSKEDGEEHWAQINRVYLNDMWSEMEKTFSDPNLLKHMTEEQIANAKKDFEKTFIEVCPKGMCHPIIEYECEECISLQFYTQKYLDSKPVHNNHSIGFIIGADEKTGKLGMKLKAAIIQEPIFANTEIIEAELFQYYKTTTHDDIFL